jgi:hypothetical protein
MFVFLFAAILFVDFASLVSSTGPNWSTINWSGYTWTVKAGPNMGPGKRKIIFLFVFLHLKYCAFRSERLGCE